MTHLTHPSTPAGQAQLELPADLPKRVTTAEMTAVAQELGVEVRELPQ